ncbi:MAG: urease accessory protein UreE [Magnetococcales bacterium]|nr:urease accessory protein UreE [Magnetococcales bacterium]
MILRQPSTPHAQPVLHLSLTWQQRAGSRVQIVGPTGEPIQICLPHGHFLRHGDVLQAEDGRIIQVEATSERLLRVTAHHPLQLARLAYHLGNRHATVEIGMNYLQFLPDDLLVHLVTALGGVCEEVVAPFTPERGSVSSSHDHGGVASGHIHEFS